MTKLKWATWRGLTVGGERRRVWTNDNHSKGMEMKAESEQVSGSASADTARFSERKSGLKEIYFCD